MYFLRTIFFSFFFFFYRNLLQNQLVTSYRLRRLPNCISKWQKKSCPITIVIKEKFINYTRIGIKKFFFTSFFICWQSSLGWHQLNAVFGWTVQPPYFRERSYWSWIQQWKRVRVTICWKKKIFILGTFKTINFL